MRAQFFVTTRNFTLAGMAVAGLLAGASRTATAEANKNMEPQAVSNQQLIEAHHVLQSVKLTLEKADHDYGGHRAAAVRDIGAAEKQLHLAIQHVHKKQLTTNPSKGGTGGGKGNAHPEPQKLSDAQLAAAVPTLKSTAELLNKADHDYGGHRVKAVADLKAAIAQLEKALAFSAAKDQNKP